MFTIVVPTFNEQDFIVSCLDSLFKQRENFELIVVDGGSSDKTIDLVSKFACRLIRLKEPNLALQLNTGALKSSGDVIIFLHADCRLAPGILGRLKKILSKNNKIIGGAFTMTIEGERFFYKIFSAGGNIYCKISKTFFGDRAIFIKKSAFDSLGGYRAIPIMTDVDFSVRMKRIGKTVLINGPVISSGRKFDKEPFWKIIFLTLWALFSYRENADFQEIKKRYYKGFRNYNEIS